MPVITLHRHDLLHPADEPDIWVNVIGVFTHFEGMRTGDLAVGLMEATRGLVTFDERKVEVTCPLESMPAHKLQRVVHDMLLDAEASAMAEWRYEVAPQPTEQLGICGLRPRRRRARAAARLRRWVGRRG